MKTADLKKILLGKTKTEEKIKNYEKQLKGNILGWKRCQIETKLYQLNKRNNPNYVHESSKLGTYRKENN